MNGENTGNSVICTYSLKRSSKAKALKKVIIFSFVHHIQTTTTGMVHGLGQIKNTTYQKVVHLTLNNTGQLDNGIKL